MGVGRTVIILFMGVCVVLVFSITPLIMTANQNKEIMTSDVQILLQEFANECAKEGQITPKRVEELETKLSTEDVQWKLELAVRVLDDNREDKSGNAKGENLDILYSDFQIREELDKNEPFEIWKGGEILVKAENITETDESRLKRIIDGLVRKDIPEEVLTATALCTVNP